MQKNRINEALMLETYLFKVSEWEPHLRNLSTEIKELLGSEYSTGLGWHSNYGYFVLATGQGPYLEWSEK